MKKILALVFIVSLCSCASTTQQNNKKQYFTAKLEKIKSGSDLGPNEVSIIYGSYGECYPQSTAFHIGSPAFHKGEWVAPILFGDIAPMLSDESLVLEPKTGKMYFAKSGKVVVSHFREILNNCSR